MKTQIHPHRPSILFLALCSIFSAPVWAAGETGGDSGSAQLETIEIRGRKHTPRQLGRERITRQKLDENMVQDQHDLVRYEPSVSVVEGGRAGSNGFAIRGVDKDRVAITVDGLAQGESRSSEGFSELFGGYGNFNTNRNAAEIENIKEVTIQKGADSITAGSGALGGAVMYRTKSPRDYVDEDKPYHIGLKEGYQSRSDQWMYSTTLAGRLGKFDGLFVYTQREGHETKNFKDGGTANGLDYITTAGHIRKHNGIVRGSPDPQDNTSKSTLGKLGYHFNGGNYLNALYEDYRQDRETDELSNLLAAIGPGLDVRHRTDVSYRKRYGLEYENLLQSGPWDKLTVNLDRQRIEMTTLTWDMPRPVPTRISEAMFRRRNINQTLDSFKIAADKHFEFGPVTWDTAYGLGMARGKNTNGNLEYWVYALYPERRTSTTDTQEFLVSSRTRNQNIYWNNTLRFGNRFKLNLGARYDRTKMNTQDSASLMYDIRRQLQLMGLWNQTADFKAPSYALGFDWNIVPALTFQAKYSTAFRAPTTDEMWLFYPSDIVYIKPNPKLKEERAKNYELAFNWHGNWGHLKLSAFRSRYRDFIDFVPFGNQPMWEYSATTPGPDGLPGAMINRHSSAIAPVYQNVNRARATIRGWEVQGEWGLDSIGLPQGSYATLSATYQKGRSDGGTPINAIRPFNGVIGLGYRQPDGRWSLGTNISYFARKKPEDTILSYDQTRQVFPYARHSRNIWLADLTGHYQLGKHVTVRGGIFNLFNRHYFTWDSLRSIREFGTVNRVDRCVDVSTNLPRHDGCAHAGIERFSAPGRNFSIVIEAKF